MLDVTWLVVVYYDGVPEAYPFNGEAAEDDARKLYDYKCQQWSDVYLTKVVEGPER